jgi:hypothetical protein
MPYNLINNTVNFLNANDLEIIGSSFQASNGTVMSDGDIDTSGAILVSAGITDSVGYAIWENPTIGDVNIEAVRGRYRFMGHSDIEANEAVYVQQLRDAGFH